MNTHLDTGERRPQLVRCGGDEFGFEPTDLTEMGDVLEQRHCSDQTTIGILHWRRAHPKRASRTVNGPWQYRGGAL